MTDPETVRNVGEAGWPDEKPVPPRYWWLKRILAAIGVLMLALACLRWLWGWEAHRRLQAEIERYQAAGQLVYAHEFDEELDAVPDDQNAAVLLEKAMDGITASTASGVEIGRFLYYPAVFDTDMEAATELMESNRDVLDLVRQARDRPQVAWSRRLAQRNVAISPGLLSSQRLLSKLLWFSATYHYRTGNHAEAVDTLHELLHFSEAVAAHPMLLSSLVSWACHALGRGLIEEFGSDLELVGAHSEPNGQVKPARREQLERLIVELMDDETPKKALVRTFYGERAYYLAILDSAYTRRMPFGRTLPKPTAWGNATGFLKRPLLELAVIRIARYETLLAEAAMSPSWPSVSERLPVRMHQSSLIREPSRSVSEIVIPSQNRSMELFFRHLAQRGMAATALAIRLFEVDNGRRPASLTELVPQYLIEVPLDPFSPDGACIRYRPDADQAVLYSVGADGNDNGGVVAITPDERRDASRSDRLFYLDGRPKDEEESGSTGSGQTGEDHENTEDNEANAKEDHAGQSKPQKW
ncbi:MAG: hypothetical protein JSU86_03805 [Phycisphaerales bacterium]|nr:MAG: hypothetical protein JSU86_03805 [Phycisphaerales bacterium]